MLLKKLLFMQTWTHGGCEVTNAQNVDNENLCDFMDFSGRKFQMI